MDPNIVGGAGGRHKGSDSVRFKTNKNYTALLALKQELSQMPKVLQYFQDRGFKPGMRIDRAYATVLGGNPNVSLSAKILLVLQWPERYHALKKVVIYIKTQNVSLVIYLASGLLHKETRCQAETLSVSEVLAPYLVLQQTLLLKKRKVLLTLC
jgi:hypothetical protein